MATNDQSWYSPNTLLAWTRAKDRSPVHITVSILKKIPQTVKANLGFVKRR